MKLSFVNQPWTMAMPPQGSDSTGIWSYQISRRLAKKHEITYYGCATTSELGKTNQIFDLNSDIEYRGVSTAIDTLLKVPKKIFNTLNFNAKLPYFGSVWFHFGYGWQIARDAALRNYDVVHIHNFSQYVSLICDRSPQTKIVLHLHCEWVNRLDRRAIASRLAKVDLVISCSDYITNKIKARFPEYAGICRTVNNGVNADYFVPPNSYPPEGNLDAPQILFVGRISPEKGLHDLVDAFIKITEQYPQATLTIAGPHIVIVRELLFDLQPEPEVQALRYFYSIDYLEYIKGKIPPHLSDQVKFTGSLLQNELLPYYQQADVVINPSLSEAFGMSLIEAMATETPVVATKIGGMPEIVDDGVTGILTPPGNSQALAEATLEILANPSQARAMGKAGRRKVLQRYTWEKITVSLIEQYAAIGVDVKSDVFEKAIAWTFEGANRQN